MLTLILSLRWAFLPAEYCVQKGYLNICKGIIVANGIKQ